MGWRTSDDRDLAAELKELDTLENKNALISARARITPQALLEMYGGPKGSFSSTLGESNAERYFWEIFQKCAELGCWGYVDVDFVRKNFVEHGLLEVDLKDKTKVIPTALCVYYFEKKNAWLRPKV